MVPCLRYWKLSSPDIIACGTVPWAASPQRLVMAEGAELAPGLRGILGIVQIFVAIGGDPQHDFLGGNRLCGQRDHLVDPVDIRHRRIQLIRAFQGVEVQVPGALVVGHDAYRIAGAIQDLIVIHFFPGLGGQGR